MAVPTARLHHGEYTTIDYTPGSDVTAGDVVVQNDLVCVAVNNIDANKLGVLAVVGPRGVWIFPKSTGTGTALSVGQVLYWDATGGVVTTTAGSNKILGKVAKAAGTSEDSVHVLGVEQKTP